MIIEDVYILLNVEVPFIGIVIKIPNKSMCMKIVRSVRRESNEQKKT